MASTLFQGGVIHSSADPFAEAVLVEDGVITWLGAHESAAGFRGRADEVVDLDGLLVTPAFVDAHVHLLATGLALEGIDLSPRSGGESAAALIDAVTRRAHATGAGGLIYGHGWDESRWEHNQPPSAVELGRAVPGREVLLVRADVHSSVVSSVLAQRLGLASLPGWEGTGHVTGEAHQRALTALTDVDSARHRDLTDLALGQAAGHGIVSVHEMAAPGLETRAGLADLIARTSQSSSGLPYVVGFWGELLTSPEAAQEVVEQIPGLTGLGGDLRVDGSLGSHTAALRAPYADVADPTSALRTGRLELSAEQIAEHVMSAAAVRLPAAFHVIGDAAMDEVLAGYTSAAQRLGENAVRMAGHRIEHAEMVDAGALAALVLLGIRLSMQPAFDDEWGGAGGLYEERLGVGRAAGLNPLADLAAAGIPLAFGSDSPVTPLDPWRAVRSALLLSSADQRVSARAAFRAHTRGGWRLAGLDHTGAGEIRVGAPAHLAFWAAPSLAVQGPERMFSTWSTDARAGTPLLPDLSPDAPAPRCVRTLRDGIAIHDELG